MLGADEDEVVEGERLARIEGNRGQLESGVDGGHGGLSGGDADLGGFRPYLGDGGFGGADDGREELVGDAGELHRLHAVALHDGLRGAEHAALEAGAVLEIDAAVFAPEESGLLADFGLIERGGLAHEEAPLTEVGGDGGRVLELELEMEQVGGARLAGLFERERLFRDQPGWQFGDEDGFLAGHGFVGLVGVGDVFQGFASACQSADRADAVTVGLDEFGLAADLELLLELGEFDAATDVGECEGDVFVFENDGFLLGRRRGRLDGEFRGSGGGNAGCGETLLQGLLAGAELGLCGGVFAGVIEVGGEQAAAEGEDDPGFTIVHGGVVES